VPHLASGEFRDYFSDEAAGYAAWRPGYPTALFAWLATLPGGTRLAWDAGTGNGQAARGLAKYFDRVLATDASANQLRQAASHPKVEYRCAVAVDSGLPAASADLVTVAQALHWFDRPAFFEEVARVLAPEGAVAVWCYGLPRITAPVDSVIEHLYKERLGRWWDLDRRLVEDGYRTIAFPFRELEGPTFTMEASWTLAHLAGFLRSWSAVRRCHRETGEDPLRDVDGPLRTAWGDPAQARVIRWPLAVRAGRA